MPMSIWHLQRFKVRLWDHAGLGGSFGHDGGREEWFDLKFTNGFSDIHASVLLKIQMPRFTFEQGIRGTHCHNDRRIDPSTTSCTAFLVFKDFARQRPPVK